MAKKHIRILSINGGGIRGYIPVLILDQISKESGQDITQLFDMVIGTSIGGMLSAAYTTPMDLKNQTLGPKYNTSEILDLMLRSRNEIFPQNSVRNQLVKAKYPKEGLDNFLINEFTINGQPALLKDTLLPMQLQHLTKKTMIHKYGALAVNILLITHYQMQWGQQLQRQHIFRQKK